MGYFLLSYIIEFAPIMIALKIIFDLILGGIREIFKPR